MAELSPELQEATADITPHLRQRMLNRAATFAEGSQHALPTLPRRRSSVYSNAQHSVRSSTDGSLLAGRNDDLDKLTSTDEPSFWHSAPLLFAVVPAFAGLLFQNGGAIVTDVLLLGFGSMFLNWCLRTPWEWYYSAQRTRHIDPDDTHDNDTIMEEDERTEGLGESDAEPRPSTASSAPDGSNHDEQRPTASALQAEHKARRELRWNEIGALMACFIGPLVGAYFLHTIRSQLTRPAEGLVSNFNLTIFVMASELRPMSHIIKMKQARMLYLQRIVRADPREDLTKTSLKELAARIADLESRAAGPVQTDAETIKMGATVRQSIQPQLDALNRAVRRYEKRQAAQSMQTEARFQELDARLKDALALAAAAARTGQRPGAISITLIWITNMVNYSLHTAWAIALSPFRTVAAAVTRIEAMFVSPDQRPRRRIKVQSNGASSTPSSRFLSKLDR